METNTAIMIHLCMFYLREHGNHNICVSYINKMCFILRGFSVYHLNNSIACVLLYQYIFVSAGRLLHMWLIRDMCCALHTHTHATAIIGTRCTVQLVQHCRCNQVVSFFISINLLGGYSTGVSSAVCVVHFTHATTVN